jgi:hypothetical protein
LAIYLFITPVSILRRELGETYLVTASELFFSIVNAFSLMVLVVVAIFIVNNTGNEFNEGSYRKSLANGLSHKAFFAGKLLIILFLVLFLVVSILLLYLSIGTLGYQFPIGELIRSISPFSLLNQTLAIFHAGLFGLFFIMVFRNRTIGLVFFPFWTVTEFVLHLFDRLQTFKGFTVYLPGVSGFRLFNSHGFDLELYIPVLVISAIFTISAWYGLVLREEKAQ